MMLFIRRVLWVLFALMLVAFSVVNRKAIFVALPFTDIAIPIAPYLLFFAGLFTGLLISGVVLSWARLKGFVARRQAEREAVHLRTRLKVQDEETSEQKAAGAYEKVTAAAQADQS